MSWSDCTDAIVQLTLGYFDPHPIRISMKIDIPYRKRLLNPLVTNGFSHLRHLDESTFIFGDIRSIFFILFNFSMKIIAANRKAPDGTPRFAASHLGLFCLPISHKTPGLYGLR